MYFKHWIFVICIFTVVFLVTLFNRDILDIDGALNKSNVEEIITYLKHDYTNINIDVDELNLEVSFTEDNIAKTLERDAAIFMRLINDLNVVRYVYDNKIYKYYFDDMNTLFDYKLTSVPLVDIVNHYKLLKKEYVYIGNIKGVYSLYSKTNECTLDNYLAKDDMFEYYIICYKKEDLVVIDKKFNVYNLDYLLDQKLVTVSDLMFYNLHIDKEVIK